MADPTTPGAAERLLDTAARLFYARGVPNVGINEIIARAGVARMTLYHHFPSKDALVKAVLEQRRVERAAWLARADEAAVTPIEQILAVFDLLESWAQTPDFRGCPLVAASFELGGQFNTALPYARDHVTAVRAHMTERARAASLEDPDRVGAELQLLLEGATVTAHLQGGAAAAGEARRAAQSLLERARRQGS